MIHRGHTWYVDESLRYLTPSARLVFLGSCHGMESAYAVMAIANRAQMIATRGIGTQSINDPLLKAINDELLKNASTLEWDPFWRIQETKLGGQTFRDYIPPPRNAAAIMLAAYYDYRRTGNHSPGPPNTVLSGQLRACRNLQQGGGLAADSQHGRNARLDPRRTMSPES